MIHLGFEEAAMSGKTDGNRGPRRAVALAVVAAVAVLATACGSSASSDSSALGGSVTYAQTVALAQCMRSHGLPDFPNPDSSGDFNLTTTSSSSGSAVDVDSSQFQTAYGACRHLLAGGGPSLGQLEQVAQQEQQALQKVLPVLLKYSQCMRGHGLPTFPDPTSTGFDLNGSDIDPESSQFQTAQGACQHVLPAGMQFSMHSSSQRGPG
jgi:hypothetical protein